MQTGKHIGNANTFYVNPVNIASVKYFLFKFVFGVKGIHTVDVCSSLLVQKHNADSSSLWLDTQAKKKTGKKNQNKT